MVSSIVPGWGRGLTPASVGKVDQAILARVKKAMALASHEGTGEAEAKAALRCVGPRVLRCFELILSQHGVKAHGREGLNAGRRQQ